MLFHQFPPFLLDLTDFPPGLCAVFGVQVEQRDLRGSPASRNRSTVLPVIHFCNL